MTKHCCRPCWAFLPNCKQACLVGFTCGLIRYDRQYKSKSYFMPASRPAWRAHALLMRLPGLLYTLCTCQKGITIPPRVAGIGQPGNALGQADTRAMSACHFLEGKVA